MSLGRSVFVWALVSATMLTSCGPKEAQTNGYREGATPGMSRQQAESILGKPQEAAPFSLPGVKADVLSYSFGQVLVQNAKVVAISVNNAPDFKGPFGVSLGMSEDELKAALAADRKHRKGHRESYDAIEKSTDTRTRDIYDNTDHVMIELAAANANDPLAAFNISQITFANAAGFRLLEQFTKARVNGLYPDVHVDNFISQPWPGAR